MTMTEQETVAAPRNDKSDVEHVDVLVVGAGVSGIGAAYHLRERFPERSLVVLEAQDNRGGTWWTHRYPGVRSDSDLFTYGYRFKPWRGPVDRGGRRDPRTTSTRSSTRTTCDEHIRYHHRVTAASWSTEDRRWTVEVTRGDTGEQLRAHHRLPVDVPGLLQPRRALPAASGRAWTGSRA